MQESAHKLFPVTHSILSTKALLAAITDNYGIDTLLECQLWHRGLNDTYLLVAETQRYILRAYRANWRSSSDILYELDMLTYLAQQDIAVSKPLPQKDGNFIHELQAPEGIRFMVLFTYAPGEELAYDKNDHLSSVYGNAVARIHQALDGFSTENNRFPLNLNYLLDTPLAAIHARLSFLGRLEDWHYLQQIADHLRQQLIALPLSELEQGHCHGDFHGWNAHISADQEITFFDFDCCGWGWRAYDIAVFRWCVALFEPENAVKRWEQYLEGYNQERIIRSIDLKAVPLFIGVRHIWLMGLQAGNGQDWGFGWMNDAYYDRSFKFLREWASEQNINV